MAASTPSTILLKTRAELAPLIKERIAAEAITPGHLVEVKTDGELRKHATAGGNASPIVAVEQNLVNNTAAADIDTACADGDQIPYAYLLPGDEVYMYVEANGAAIVIGDLLESAGDGTLQKYTAPSQAVDEGGSATYTIAPKVRAPLFRALEAKDNSANGSAARIKVEVV